MADSASIERRSIRPGPIVVIGSINMDLVCRVPHIPKPGQTLLGSDLATIPGGKGANQAVAAAKLGADVHFVGRVGEDDFGQRLLNGLQNHHVNTRHIAITEGASTGCALILVDKKGENSIVVAPGANQRLTPDDIDAAEALLRRASIVILQLEIPYDTVTHAIDVCRRLETFTILDPAPAPPRGMAKAMFNVDILTPNQSEAEALLPPRSTGRFTRTKRADAKQIGSELLGRGVRCVVLKLGAKGAMIQDRTGYIDTVKPFAADVVDTTAAGDAFTAALAVAFSEGKTMRQSVKFANAAGAIATESFGAQPSLPTREQVEKRTARR